MDKNNKYLSEEKIEEFKSLLRLGQKDILKVLKNNLKNIYKKENFITNEKQTFLYYEGTSPVLLVAHMDTVYDTEIKNYSAYGIKNNKINSIARPYMNIYYDSTNHIMWSPDGLGADDRLGIWIIINILRDGYRPHILFTTDEEIGAFGADDFVEEYFKNEQLQNSFNKLKYMIELDRRGEKDCVFYDTNNMDFEKYVESFGWKKAIGSFSDINVLSTNIDIASVNLSVGYYSEHSLTEHCDLLQATKNLTIIESMIYDSYKNEVQYFKSNYIAKNYGIYNNYNYINYSNNNSSKGMVCDCCGLPADELVYNTLYNGWLCDNCYEYFKEYE